MPVAGIVWRGIYMYLIANCASLHPLIGYQLPAIYTILCCYPSQM